MPSIVDLTGRRFGRWTVVAFASRENRKTLWRCRCNCGTERDVMALTLTRKTRASESCGCLARELSRGRAPSLTHGLSRTREYRIWKGMKNRCENERTPDYERYGARGITVCDRWQDFEAFIADMGPAPTDLYTIDRRDNALGYSAENCRWATQAQQQRNRTNNKIDETDAEWIRWAVEAGEPLASVAERYGVSKKLIGNIAKGLGGGP